ncbi:cytochrome P450 [Streptomyces clavuligerus]|uniref:cytochrome P450 n=1 Tax=Streptomyces clavuligerus TaxID=1901 RepID=UPI000185213E|nr:cytochrome P450 [Streptomyces clavuligerus]WDN52607.1 cytochrome P450 [Streptomyces clavuligerus]
MADFVFDPLDAEFLENPYPVLRALRQDHPAHWHEGMRSWIFSRYDDCREILHDTERFGADPRAVGQELPPARVSIQTLDGEEHARIQRVVVAALQEADFTLVERRMARLLRRPPGSGADTVDFVQDIALPVTTRATLSLFGLPADAEERIADSSTVIVRSMMHGLLTEGETDALAARAAVTDILDTWYGRTGDGLLGAIHRRPEAAALDRTALLNSLRVVLLAGINSTQRLLSLAVRTLLARPRGLKEFRAAPSGNRAVHELIRYEGSAQSAARFCRETTTLHGRRVRRGEQVVALLGSANRDERRFADPDGLDLDRHPNPHLGFGRGTHACLGIPLTLSIARGTLETLGRDHPGAALAGPVVIEPNPALRGLTSLPVRLR